MDASSIRPSSASRGPRCVQRGLQELHGDLLEPSSGRRRLRHLQLHYREERHQQRPVDARHLFLHQDLLQGEQISAEILTGKDNLTGENVENLLKVWQMYSQFSTKNPESVNKKRDK